MNKNYEKPTAAVISFQLKEDLTIGGETGNKSAGDFWDNFNSFDPGKSDYQLR